MNINEAKTVIYLANATNELKTTFCVAGKLDMSYTSAYNILKIMEAKQYVRRVESNRKVYWEVKATAVYDEAKAVIIGGEASCFSRPSTPSE